MSLFDRALSVYVGLRSWSPQWANRGGVYEKIWEFGDISQFWGICKHAISVEMIPFDRARRALSVYVDLMFWSPQ